jgi:tetratricopeptide (TPR) repeat protein/two-component sensor histidine kinase
MLKRFLSILGLLLASQAIFAQNQMLDSLIAALRMHSKPDTLQVDLLNKIAYSYLSVNLDSTEAYASRAENAAADIDYFSGVSESLKQRGVAYRKKGKVEEALVLFNKSLEISTEHGDSLGMGEAHYNIGNAYQEQGSYELSISEMIIAIQFFEGLKEVRKKMYALNTMAILYYRIKDLEGSLRTFKECLEVARGAGWTADIGTFTYNIGNTYLVMGNAGEATSYYQQALEIYESTGSMEGQSNILNNLATIFFRNQDYQKAVIYHLKALEVRRKAGLSIYVIESLNNLAATYGWLGDFVSAEKYYAEAKSMLPSAPVEFRMTNMRIRYRLDSLKGNTNGAFVNFQGYVNLRDSLMNAKKASQIADLQIKYDTEKKEREIERLDQQTKIQQLQLTQQGYIGAGSAVVVVLLLAVGFLYYRQERLRQHEAVVELEQKALRSQLNPHFIFNALGAIQNYMLQNKPQDAASFMSRFARLMRQILENSREDFITLDEEVATLENYLELQLLRFDNSFEYELTVDEAIDVEQVSIPPMFAQPLIENALEHGLKGKIDGAKVKITFRQEGEYVLLTVEDNGKGIASEVKTREGHKSLAGVITNERIDLFNAGLKTKIRLIVEDLAGGGSTGTRVQLMLPYREG